MSASYILVKRAKEAAARKAAENGHSLGLWQKGRSTTWARCSVCGADVTVARSDGSISGPALVAHCKVPTPAPGRAA